MNSLSLLIVAVAAFSIGYFLGSKAGLRKGLSIAKGNSSNLISQLKDANKFATNLREDERAEKEATRASREVN